MRRLLTPLVAALLGALALALFTHAEGARAQPTAAWAVSPGSTAYDIGYGVSTLADGSSIITGVFSGTATFGSTTLTSAGSYDVFVAKFSSPAPASVPGAPTSPSATAGDGQATVSWTAPASDGGSPVTSYTVSAVEDPARTCTTPDGTTTCTVTGLANGTSYTFTVTATNAVGTGVASVASAAVVPAGAPGAPSAPSTPPTNPVPGSSPADDAPISASPLPAPLTSAYTASGGAPVASGLAYSVRLLPSRTTLRAGQQMRLGVRIRSRYAISSTARTSAALSGCVRLPSSLVIMRLPPGSLRSGQLVCWRLGGMAAGRQRTMVLTVRAASARAVSRSIEAWARERGEAVRERMRTSMRVRIQPRAPRVAVTG